MFQSHMDEDDTVEQQLRSELTVLEAKSHLENSNLRAENIKLYDQLVEAKVVIDRCWKALGIENFEQAKPLAVYEHIAKLRAENIKLRDDLVACAAYQGSLERLSKAAVQYTNSLPKS